MKKNTNDINYQYKCGVNLGRNMNEWEKVHPLMIKFDEFAAWFSHLYYTSYAYAILKPINRANTLEMDMVYDTVVP